jgi:hypothetical protein
VCPTSCETLSAIAETEVLKTQHGTVAENARPAPAKLFIIATPPAPGEAVDVGVIMQRIRLPTAAEL